MKVGDFFQPVVMCGSESLSINSLVRKYLDSDYPKQVSCEHLGHIFEGNLKATKETKSSMRLVNCFRNMQAVGPLMRRNSSSKAAMTQKQKNSLKKSA